jgi:hypothetical protein
MVKIAYSRFQAQATSCLILIDSTMGFVEIVQAMKKASVELYYFTEVVTRDHLG